MIGPKGSNFQGLMGIIGVVIRKFGEDWDKTLPVGLFFFFKIFWLGSQLYA